jgi:hypothetical protein
MRQTLQLSDDGELTKAVDVPDPSVGTAIHFTTGREVFYPSTSSLSEKKKRTRHLFAVDPAGRWAWRLVIGCIGALLVIILLVAIYW